MGCLLVADAAPARLKQPLQAEHHYARAVGAANFRRSAPFLRIVQSIDPGALVAIYVRAYPRFQRAYEELGYPGSHRRVKLKASEYWHRGEFVAEGGWATMPGREEPNHTVAAMCAARLSEIKS